MRDLTNRDYKKDLLRIREELLMSKKEIKMLRGCIKEMEEGQKTETSPVLAYTKLFQEYYKQEYKVGYVIPNWATQNQSMRTTLDLLSIEGKNSPEEIKAFLKWSVRQKTYTGEKMVIPYLKVIIQDYLHRMQEEEISSPSEESKKKIEDSLNRRF